MKEYVERNPQSKIAEAWQFAKKAHAGQKRKSGEPYFNHSVATAETLWNWNLDETSVVSGLLHDTVEDTPVTLEEVKQKFGEETSFLVDGVTKLGRIKYRGVETKVENLRKMFFALSEDLRVVFIKLADRLHNMRTLAALPAQKQKRIALETDDIYAPIAYRLGMQNLAGELHDLAFPYLYPQEYRWLTRTVKDEYAEREKYLNRILPQLQKALKENGIQPLNVDFRAKRYSSLYHKLLRHDMDLDKIYDLVAMRIILSTVSECYTALGIIHQVWPPLPGRIKDYIAMPKPNGYRSLHTTIIGPEEKIVEIQIRTKQMHEENENGIAAHWLYEQNRLGTKTRQPAKKMAEEVKWVQQLRRWQENFMPANSEEFLQAMKIDFFKDRIFAITPKGDVIDLPNGATPVDFAYQIHSEIGNTCVAAKVNDQFMPLEHELRSGDMVQILTQKNKRPSEDWLKFVKTTLARDQIRTALRSKDGRLRGGRSPSKVEFRVVAKGRVGILKDVSGAIAEAHFSILGLHTANQVSEFPIIKIQCAMTDKQKVERLALKLKRLKDVRQVSYQLL